MIINTLWILIASVLVFFMQAGFALVESGFTRSKNTVNILMKNVLDFVAGSILFFLIGFSLMFGKSNFGFVGSLQAFESMDLGLGVSNYAFLFFQTVFAATAVTIVSGAIAERMKFSTYVVISAILTTVIYPISGHWVWGGGWLASLGFHDFAGSSVVHALGGFSALAAVQIIGPRLGKFGKDGKAKEIKGHNMTLGALGVFILWFGWFGFNPGSTLGLDDIDLVSKIFLTTNLSASAGALTALFYSWYRNGKSNLAVTLNGVLAGLVGITAGCDVVSLSGAIVIGIISSLVVSVGAEILENKFKIDDPVGAISVHGIGGITGTILTGVFATSNGLLYTGDFTFLLIQLFGSLVFVVWGYGVSYAIYKVLDLVFGLRVSEEEELIGLDLSEHNSECYPNFQIVEN